VGRKAHPRIEILWTICQFSAFEELRVAVFYPEPYSQALLAVVLLVVSCSFF